MEVVQILLRKRGDPERHQLRIPLDADDTVHSLAEKVAQKTGLSSDSMKIVFCGRRLSDTLSVADLKLGPQTCLTITIVDEPPAELNEFPPNYQADNEGGFEIVEHSDVPSPPTKFSSFYVFCKKCEKLNRGKLRAYCNECNGNAIVFIDEPSKWSDVIGSDKIRVDCQSCAKTTAANFVFKCVDCNEEAPALSNIRSNKSDSECLICGEMEPVVFALDCQHAACVACLSAYLEQLLDQWLFVYHDDVGFTMRCIMVDCDHYIKDPHHFYLMGIANYKKFQRIATEKFLCIQEGLNYCPYAECGASFTVELDEGDEENSKVMCPECQRIFCSKCKTRGGCVCKAKSEAEDLIRSISKPCPRCKAPTERNEGCAHLRCPNCTFEWCFVCGKPWTDGCQWDHWFD